MTSIAAFRATTVHRVCGETLDYDGRCSCSGARLTRPVVEPAAMKDAASGADVLAVAREEEIVFCDLNGTPDPYQTPGNRRTRREADALKARHAVAFAGRRAAAETASIGPVPAPDPYAAGLKALRERYGRPATRAASRPAGTAPPDPYAASIEAHRRALGVA